MSSSEAPATSPAQTGRARLATTVFVVTWLAVGAALQWSVVRFRVLILLTLTAAAVVLARALARRVEPAVPPQVASVAVVGSLAVLWTVPLFTYLEGAWRTAALVTLTVLGLALAALLWLAPTGSPRAPWTAATAATALVGQALLGVVVILGDRAPRIDVWVVLQQASDALGRGDNFYTLTWTGSPGVKDLHPYLPWMTVLLAPGRWIAGDVRWALLAWSLVLLGCVLALARSHRAAAAGVAAMALLVVFPGTITQVDQAWTEPLLAALIALWAVLVTRGHPWWAVLPLALACASKQHLVLLVPLLMVWPAFGWRRVLVTGGVTGVLVAPWLVADRAAFVHDTVTALVSFHPIRFANTWYLFFHNDLGVDLPFWVTGLVVVAVVGVATLTVARRRPDLGELLRWAAVVLAVANLVNKQAFYNQFWLSMALVALSLAAPAGAKVRTSTPGRAGAAASEG